MGGAFLRRDVRRPIGLVLSHISSHSPFTHTLTHTHTTAPTCKVCNGVWRVDVISQRRRYSTHARAAGRTLTISLCSSLTSEFEHSIVLSWSGMSSSADADAVSVCAEWGDPLRAMRGDPLRAMRVRTFADPTLSSCFCLNLNLNSRCAPLILVSFDRSSRSMSS